jgi:L-threonylcarbamoyladenylate synthase
MPPDTKANEIAHAVATLRAGGLVAFPTETVYGLGADASNETAIKKVFAAKGRPHDHPLIVHLASAVQLKDWAREIPSAAQTLAKKFWPGPLTLILKRATHVSDLVTGGQDTVALRVPSHPMAQALLKAFGGGVVGPSANRFGHVSATTAEHVRQEFGDAIDYVLDGGACEVGIESTIIDLSRAQLCTQLCNQPALLRPGAITAAQIEAALGTPLAAPDAQSPRAPGTLEKHYAPRTPVMLVEGDLIDELARSFARQGKRVAVLARSARQPLIDKLTWIAAPQTPAGYAHDLYANLRTLDAAGCDVMLVEEPPLATAWAAVRDRLGRAAAGTQTP